LLHAVEIPRISRWRRASVKNVVVVTQSIVWRVITRGRMTDSASHAIQMAIVAMMTMMTMMTMVTTL